MIVDRLWTSLFSYGLILGTLAWTSPASSEETYYTVTHYQDGSKFMTGHERRLTQGPQGFKDQGAAPKRSRSDCGMNLMHFDEAFSLKTMVDRGVITQEEYHFFSSIAARLEESQVVFFHEFLRFTHEELSNLPVARQKKLLRLVNERLTANLEFKKVTNERTPETFAQEILSGLATPKYDFKEAGLYLVRGQGWDHDQPRRILKLPWQMEKAFSHAATLDRIQFPLAFELGRAAQASSGKIEELLKLAVVQMTEDAHAYGVSFDKVPVYVHATNPINSELPIHSELYRNKYGFKDHATDPERPNNQILMTTLAELEARYPVNKTLESIPRIRNASKDRLTDKGAADIQRKFFEETYHFLDTKPNRGFQDKPILIINELWEMGGLLAEDFIRHGIRDDATINSIIKSLHENKLSSPFIPENAIIDTIMNFEVVNGPSKALRIQNLDPAHQRQNKNYVALILLAVRDHYIRKVRRMETIAGGTLSFPPPVYSIVTSDSDLIRAAKALGAKEFSQKLTQPSHDFGIRTTSGNQSQGRMNLEVRELTVSHLQFPDVIVQMLTHHHADLAKKAEGALSLGRWHENARLHFPLLR